MSYTQTQRILNSSCLYDPGIVKSGPPICAPFQDTSRMCTFLTRLWQLAKLIFCVNKFMDEATVHSIEIEFKTNEQLATSYPDRKLPEQRVQEFRKREEERSKKVRIAIIVSFLWVAAVTLLALLSAYFAPIFVRKWAAWLQVAAAVLILWGVLGKLGWAIQTYKGVTLPEQINEFWFRLVTILGMYLMVFSLFIQIWKVYFPQ